MLTNTSDIKGTLSLTPGGGRLLYENFVTTINPARRDARGKRLTAVGYLSAWCKHLISLKQIHEMLRYNFLRF